MSWFETIDSKVVHSSHYFRLRHDTVRMPDATEQVREVMEIDDAVGVLPIMDDGTVLLLRQYRHPHGRYFLEIPAGKLDVDGEDVEDAARRELVEEVGFTAGVLEHLVTFANSVGGSTERTHLYVGRDLREEHPPDSFEAEAEEPDMEIVRIALADAVRQARTGSFDDAKTLIALLLADRTTT